MLNTHSTGNQANELPVWLFTKLSITSHLQARYGKGQRASHHQMYAESRQVRRAFRQLHGSIGNRHQSRAISMCTWSGMETNSLVRIFPTLRRSNPRIRFGGSHREAGTPSGLSTGTARHDWSDAVAGSEHRGGIAHPGCKLRGQSQSAQARAIFDLVVLMWRRKLREDACSVEPGS
jgi:hypothetical protein